MKTLDYTRAKGINKRLGLIEGEVFKFNDGTFIKQDNDGDCRLIKVIESTVRYQTTAYIGKEPLYQGDIIMNGDTAGKVVATDYLIYIDTEVGRHAIEDFLKIKGSEDIGK